MSQSISPKERLRSGQDFKSILDGGRKSRAEELLLWVSPNGAVFNRIGFSAPRKCFRLSVKRNRVRRLLREAYRRNKEKLKLGYDIVVMLKCKDPLPALREIESKLLEAFSKVGMLK